MIPLSSVLILAALLFSIGLLGVLIRRNVILVFISLELMLNAVNLVLLGFGAAGQLLQSQIAVIFLIAIAAVESAIALSLALMLNASGDRLDMDDLNQLKG